MKKNKTFKLVFSLLFTLLLTTSSFVNSQTVVQWYTSMGNFRVQLREDLVPITVQNFVDLVNDEFYDGLIFHRVISGFMIQDGCPNGNGTGGPGYTFDDEFHPDIRHDEPGMLSMANSGPNTNGSQYFITVAATSWLDDVHSVFGKVMDGMDVVYAISEVETNSNDKPIIDVVIDSIRVVVGDPVIELISPIAGMKWNGHFQNEIQWESEFIADVKLEFSSDNGQSWSDIVDETSANTRSYFWAAPANLVSTECLIKISDVANPDVFSVIQNPFTLCKLELLSPNGYEIYRAGTPVEIIWNSELVDDLKISYQATADGDWVLIDEGIPATNNSYLWTPEESSFACKIKLEEVAHPEAVEMSANGFFVFQLDLISPTGGEIIEGSTLFDVNWESAVINEVKIEFSSDSLQTWSVITDGVAANDSTYSWEVPYIDADYCFIKLTAPGQPNKYSINHTSFSIEKHVGINNEYANNKFNINIFPNPVAKLSTITYGVPNNNVDNLKIEIYNSVGKIVYENNSLANIGGKQNLEVDLEFLKAGIYIISISGNNKSAATKFIKK